MVRKLYPKIIIDEHLTFKEYMTQLKQKLNRTNGLRAKLEHQVSSILVKTIYFVLVKTTSLKQLTENNLFSTFWLSLTLCSTSKGSRKQKYSGYDKKSINKALRIISFKTRTEPSDPLYANHKVLKLQNIITLNNSLFIYNQLCDNLPNAF